MQTSPERRRPSLALVLSVLALLVATGSTSYAAGLARNSVGTAQLKANAVTSAKIKAGAVTGAKVKDGSIAAADLAGNVLRPRPILFDQSIPVRTPLSSVITVARLELGFACEVNAENGEVLVVVTLRSSQSTSTAGSITIFSSESFSSRPSVSAGGNGVVMRAESSAGSVGNAVFVGQVRPGTAPWVDVTLSASAPSNTSGTCSVHLSATPTS